MKITFISDVDNEKYISIEPPKPSEPIVIEFWLHSFEFESEIILKVSDAVEFHKLLGDAIETAKLPF